MTMVHWCNIVSYLIIMHTVMGFLRWLLLMSHTSMSSLTVHDENCVTRYNQAVRGRSIF